MYHVHENIPSELVQRGEAKVMTMERWVRLIAGAMIMASVALGWWVSPWFYLFTAFVGANLFQSALSGWCLMESILSRFGMKRCGETADPQGRQSS